MFPLCPHNSKLEAAPLANPSPCLDSPFHILLHFLFRVLFTATPSANPILSLDSPFHSLLPCSAVLQPCQRLHSNQKQLLQQTQFSAWILLSTVLSPCLEFCSQLLLWWTQFSAWILTSTGCFLGSPFACYLATLVSLLASSRLQPHFRRLLFADYPVGRSSSLAPSGLELQFRRLLLPTNLSGQSVRYSPQNHIWSVHCMQLCMSTLDYLEFAKLLKQI